MTEAQAAIARVWEDYCSGLLAGDAVRLANLFTVEAQMMQPNMADINGRPAVLELFKQLGRHDVAETQSVELAVVGDSAYEFGEYHSVHSQPDPIEYRGRVAVSWRRADDGNWQIHRMMLTPISATQLNK